MSLNACIAYELEVVEKEFLSQSVIRLRIAPIPGNEMPFEAGQFLSIELPDGDTRSYSMANSRSADGAMELQIRLHEHGKYSRVLRTDVDRGSRLKARGPFGTCTWQKPANASTKIIMLATGTGLAPLLALLEHAQRSGHPNPIWLYWGGITLDDLYFDDRLKELENSFEQFHYIPVLSKPESGWMGQAGFVQNVAANQHPDLDDALVYACGAPVMVDSARNLLTATCNLQEKFFFADAFESATTKPTNRSDQLVEVSLRTSDGLITPVQIPDGETLMAGLRSQGHIQGVCGGKASCGTCRINIHPDWVTQLNPASRAETRLLATLDGSHPSDRLACQLVVTKKLNGLDFTIPEVNW